MKEKTKIENNKDASNNGNTLLETVAKTRKKKVKKEKRVHPRDLDYNPYEPIWFW